MVPLAFDETEVRALVDVPRGHEHVVRPQGELAVAGVASEADAFVDEFMADTQATCAWLDEEEAQLRDAF